MTPRKLYVACWGEIVANDFRPATIGDAEAGRKLWVSQEDYAALAAENERLKSEKQSLNIGISNCGYSILQNIDEKAALAAENERLRKAGDVTIAAYCMGEKNVEKYRDNPVVAYWLAAKEGRGAK